MRLVRYEMNDSAFRQSFLDWLTEGHLLERPSINVENAFVVNLSMLRNDIALASGSGFLWRLADGIGVVTAWHNLSGLHHTTRQVMHPMGAIPNYLRLRITQREPLAFRSFVTPLYLDDEEAKPRWFVHNKAGSYFDIAWVGLSIDRPEAFLCINDHFDSFGKGQLQPGGEVLVAGFPHGIGPFGVVPVWKRASIASNMRVPVNGLPRFLVDVAGRQGMSGAFVCGRQSALEEFKFIGIYTGRATSPGTTRESSDLGFVWWNDIVQETLSNGVLDEVPEVGKGVITLSESVSVFGSVDESG